MSVSVPPFAVGSMERWLGPYLTLQAAITKIPSIGWLINNRYLFFTVLKVGNSKIKTADLCLMKTCFLVHRRLSLTLSSQNRRSEGAVNLLFLTIFLF